MSYGIQLFNRAGLKTVDTAEGYAVEIAGTPTSTSADGATLPNPVAGEIILARPQDGESGVITSTRIYDANTNTSTYNIFGQQTYEYTWGTARGSKILKLDRISDSLSPAGSGYGVEVYNSAGTSLLFSSNTPNIATLEVFVELPFPSVFEYQNPSGLDFNDVYVEIFSMYTINQNVPGSPFSASSHIIAGSYAHFNDTTETITLVHSGASSPTSWDDFGNYTTIGTKDTALACIYRISK